MADSSDVADALDDADPARTIQPYAERVRADAGVSFHHGDVARGSALLAPELIGGQFVGTTAPALEGRAFSETYTGTLGPSLRTVISLVELGRPDEAVAIAVEELRMAQGLTDQVVSPWTSRSSRPCFCASPR